MKKLLFIILGVSFFFIQPVLASTTDGTIDPTYKYAWGENLSWVNFGATNGNIHVTDSELTGYAWSQVYGWINLAPTNSGVKNTCDGELTGYAWGQNVGWINFTGVTIDSSGKFGGIAGTVSTTPGRISFDCTNCDVRTDWRPSCLDQSACSNGIDDDGDGKIDYPNDPGCTSAEDNNETDPISGGSSFIPPPAPIISVTNPISFINNVGETINETNTRSVIIKFTGVEDATEVAISNNSNFSLISFTPYFSTTTWTLTEGNGIKKVYVKFRTAKGGTAMASQTIILNGQSSEQTGNGQGIICPLTPTLAYKLSTASAVYYITTDCTKRAFTRPDIFFTYFNSWNDVKTTTKEELNSIPNDTLGFMPYGPKYDPQYGALIKITKDPKVYLLLNTEKYWITSESVFNQLNYQWNWIEDVDERLLDKYTLGSEINYTDHHPNYTLIKYPNSNKVYRLEPNPTDSTKQVKRWIIDETTFKSLHFRWDRIVTISNSEIYLDGTDLKLNKYIFNNDLVYGDNNEEIKQLQIRLKELGLFTAEPNGNFGNATKNAVTELQRLNKIIPITGNVGEQTRKILNSD